MFFHSTNITAARIVIHLKGWLLTQRGVQNELFVSVTFTKLGFDHPDCNPQVTIFTLVLIYFENETFSELFFMIDS